MWDIDGGLKVSHYSTPEKTFIDYYVNNKSSIFC